MSATTVKNKPTIYGLTGGIASGKTTAVLFFKDKGVKVFESDSYVRHLWQNNETLIKKVNEKYNIDIKTDEGRKSLANIIFNSELDKAFINSLVHPFVFEGVSNFVNENINEKYIIVDMPLLFEVGYDIKVDKTILIYTTSRNQLTRLMKRDNLSKEDAKKRINSQINLKDKRSLSTYVINNTRTIDKLHDKLNLMYEVMNNERK